MLGGSGFGLEAPPVQNSKDGEHVIAYARSTLMSSESNYSTTEKKWQALCFAVRRFLVHQYGRSFGVVTDHNLLYWPTNLRDPAGIDARCAVRLHQFDFSLI